MSDLPVPAIPATTLTLFFTQIGVLLLAALVLGRCAVRLRLPAVVGELTAGIVLGPSLLGWLSPQLSGALFPREAEQFHLLDGVGQVGVVLLVALAGIEINRVALRARRIAVVGVSVGGMVLPLSLGVAAGFVVPATLVGAGTDRGVFALFLGLAMAVSAIPVIAKIMMELGLSRHPLGQIILAAATIDDACAWVLLAVVAALAAPAVGWGGAAGVFAALVLVLVVAQVLGRPLVAGVLRWAGRREPGATVIAVAVLVFAAAATTQALHLEAVFGAFVCGLLVGSSPAFDRSRVEPLRVVVLTVLAPLFFATVGLRTDLTALGAPGVLGAAVAILTMAVVGKFVGAYAGGRAGGLGHREGLVVGSGMNARGVVELIVASVGLQLGVLTGASYTILVLVAVGTSVLAGPMLRVTVARLPAHAAPVPSGT